MVCTIAGPLLFGCMLSYMFNPLVTRIEKALAGSRFAKRGASTRPVAAIITVVMPALLLLVMLGGLAAVLSDGLLTLGWGSL